MTIAVMVFRMAYVSALAAGLLIAAAGLLSPGGAPEAFAQTDTTAPTISSIAITNDTGDEDSIWDDDGVYGIGDRIRVTITFSENMTVTGSPRLELDIGGAAKPAEYESAEGNKVAFGYTVTEGDADNDGIAVGENKLTLNTGSIKDAADNAADLSHSALTAQNNHRVDGVRPTISRVALTHSRDGLDDIYVPGETLVASVEFNEDVLVAGSPRLALDFQGTTRLADFKGVYPRCESDEGQPHLLCFVNITTTRGIILSFDATVLEGDEDQDGVAIAANALSLNGGSIEDAAGNGAVLTHDTVAPNSGFLVDGVSPSISAIAITSDPGDDNSYGIGDQVEVTVTFDEDVTVSQGWGPYLPRLMLSIGGKTKVAKYVVSSSPDPMKFMKFTYTVEDGDSDNNGIAVGANKLQLLAIKVYDTPAKNPADITHQALPDDPGHMVSTPASSTESEETSTTQKSGLLKITGEARVGELLTADTSDITDDDGLDHAVFYYWWFSDYLPIDIGLFSAISYPDYEIRPTDAGTAIQVKLAFYDDAGNREERVSANAIQVPGCPMGEALPVWSADMSVVEYTSVSIGAVGSDLFSNVCGTSDFRIKSLWSYTPDRDLRLAFEDPIPNAEDLTLYVSDLALPFPARSSGQSKFKWTDVDVDWEDGQTISGTIVLTSTLAEVAPNTPATGVPTITGVPQVDEILRPRTSGIADVDGLTNANFAYQWVIGGSEISGVTGFRYRPWIGDVGKTIQVTVTFTDDAGNEETLTSEPTAEVVAKPSEVTITGEARVGETIKANTTGIIDEDGLDNATFQYTWSTWVYAYGWMWHLHSSSEPYYTVQESDIGDFIVVTVTFDDDASNEEVRTSSPTERVQPASNNLATGGPTIIGESRVGETLSVDTSEISDLDGLDNAAFSYQWVSSDGTADTDIAGATASTYTPSVSDLSKTIKVRVSFTDDADNAESLTSAATATVAPTVPTEPLRLTVSRGSQIQELDASWEAPDSNGGSAITGYKVQWKEAAANWNTEDDVSEAEVTGTTYTITGLTGGVEYGVRVVATNDVGDGPASSEAMGTPSGAALQQVVEPENTAPTGAPTIDGIVRVGERLTANTSGIADADALSNPGYSYQWLRSDGADDTDIAGATGEAYTLVEADEGKTIRVKVTFTDDGDTEETLTSDPTAVVAPDPGPLTGFAVVDTSSDPDTSLGTIEDGGTLILENPNGGSYGIRADTNSNDDFGRVHLVLSGAKSKDQNEGIPPYSLYGDSGEGNLTGESLPVGSYTLTATAYDDNGGKLGTLTVSFTVAVQEQTAVPNTAPTGLPTITGVAEVGEELTANTSAISDADGLSNVSYSYQWLRSDGADDTDIAGATGEAYTLVEADEGQTIRVKVTFTDDGDTEETLTSDPTAEVEAAPNSPATGAPTISGAARLDETLRAEVSAIADEDGLNNVEYTYQWIRNDGTTDTDIADATGDSYQLTKADIGKTIKVEVSFTDDSDHQESRTSAPTAEVTAPPLTASLHNQPASHSGQEVFTFQLHFSEEFELSFKVLRDHAFTVSGGTVVKAKRVQKGVNSKREIHVQPDGNGAVTIVLPITTGCGEEGAICTEDGRKLSNRLELTVSGPGG